MERAGAALARREICTFWSEPGPMEKVWFVGRLWDDTTSAVASVIDADPSEVVRS